ncbi:uncharacterized protein LOC119092897 [Pollicipes pollicipes]|uniref:uncharacterized protein LOC119092897 n=1 Tax=Pollicipes pollicipes TaxID=41117 RepID=UPI00188561A9|nr:uncharacterized protein LOC119092897 [Pollicipes pollicipes]
MATLLGRHCTMRLLAAMVVLLAAHARAAEERCPCTPRPLCPGHYGTSPLDVLQFGVLRPCPRFGYFRCCRQGGAAGALPRRRRPAVHVVEADRVTDAGQNEINPRSPSAFTIPLEVEEDKTVFNSDLVPLKDLKLIFQDVNQVDQLANSKTSTLVFETRPEAPFVTSQEQGPTSEQYARDVLQVEQESEPGPSFDEVRRNALRITNANIEHALTVAKVDEALSIGDATDSEAVSPDSEHVGGQLEIIIADTGHASAEAAAHAEPPSVSDVQSNAFVLDLDAARDNPRLVAFRVRPPARPFSGVLRPPCGCYTCGTCPASNVAAARTTPLPCFAGYEPCCFPEQPWPDFVPNDSDVVAPCTPPGACTRPYHSSVLDVVVFGPLEKCFLGQVRCLDPLLVEYGSSARDFDVLGFLPACPRGQRRCLDHVLMVYSRFTDDEEVLTGGSNAFVNSGSVTDVERIPATGERFPAETGTVTASGGFSEAFRVCSQHVKDGVRAAENGEVAGAAAAGAGDDLSSEPVQYGETSVTSGTESGGEYTMEMNGQGETVIVTETNNQPSNLSVALSFRALPVDSRSPLSKGEKLRELSPLERKC